MGHLGQQSRRARMRRVGFGDHRIAGGDRRGKVAAGDAVERERKIVRTKHPHRPQRCMAGANALPGVDRRSQPTAISRGSRGLAQLAGRARQFDVGQPRLHRQGRLGVGHRHQLRREPLRYRWRNAPESRRRARHRSRRNKGVAARRRVQRRVDVGPGAHRVYIRQRLALGWILGPKDAALLRRAPPVGDQNGLHGHKNVQCLNFNHEMPANGSRIMTHDG